MQDRKGCGAEDSPSSEVLNRVRRLTLAMIRTIWKEQSIIAEGTVPRSTIFMSAGRNSFRLGILRVCRLSPGVDQIPAVTPCAPVELFLDISDCTGPHQLPEI